MFALDTNTVIYYFKGLGGVSERLLATPPQEVALPSIVVYELERGVLKAGNTLKRRDQLASFLDAFTILPFGRAEGVAAAQISSVLEARGLPIGPLDVLIATALACGATLVTRNLREFSRVEGLQVTSWYDEGRD